MSDEATVTVSVPSPEEPAGDQATALAAGAAGANAAHAQAQADEAQRTAEAAQATAEAALRNMGQPGLSAEEIRSIVRAELESAVITAPTSEPEVEEVEVEPSAEPQATETPGEPPGGGQRRGHPLMRAFLGRRN